VADHCVWLLPLWGREVLSSWTFGPAPVALPDEERTSYNLRIYLSRSLIYDLLFRFNYTACLAFVVYTDDLRTELKGLPGGCGWQRLEESYESLAVYNTTRIKFWDAGDGSRRLAGVEVDNFLGGAFEC
jgi:hypothetical protein